MLCPACQEDRLAPFFAMGEVPVQANVLAADAAEARRAPRGELTLGLCPVCALLFNPAFDPGRVHYSAAYENSLHFSPHFQAWARSLAKRLVETWRLAGGEVVEIGCGKGEFLALLVEAGCARGLGIDASFDPGALEALPAGVEFRTEGFAEPERVPPADLVCARHVLEHVAEPGAFLDGLRRAAARRPGCGVYLEVPNALYTLRDLGIWDLIYEHCAYFTAPALETLLRRRGLEPLRMAPDYGEQFLAVDARPGAPDAAFRPGAEAARVRTLAADFARRFEEKTGQWREALARWEAEGRRVALWGAGSKGVTFLNVLGPARAVAAVVDVNPRKQGRFVPGTGHPVVPPEALREQPVDRVLVMNPVYADEITRTLRGLGSRAEVRGV